MEVFLNALSSLRWHAFDLLRLPAEALFNHCKGIARDDILKWEFWAFCSQSRELQAGSSPLN